MSEMVERVAKAITDAWGTHVEGGPTLRDWLARAAIEAVREHLRTENDWFEECQECAVHENFATALQPST